jgi:excisionase family DNA binding protein
VLAVVKGAADEPVTVPAEVPSVTHRVARRPKPARRDAAATTAAGTEQRWLTATEAASYLGLPSERALYQCVRRGQVKAHRLGRRLRFRGAELDAVLSR